MKNNKLTEVKVIYLLGVIISNGIEVDNCFQTDLLLKGYYMVLTLSIKTQVIKKCK